MNLEVWVVGGEDLIMDPEFTREKFPMSVECKNQEKVNVWESYKQVRITQKTIDPNGDD